MKLLVDGVTLVFLTFKPNLQKDIDLEMIQMAIQTEQKNQDSFLLQPYNLVLVFIGKKVKIYGSMLHL